MAKAMNCGDLQDGEPCNRCETCRSITLGHCLDVIELDAASNRGIDEVRDLRENVRFAPSSCRFKVYIIDEAHQLTKEAFNALLKTLEEPPPHAKFILATTEAEKMPETIVSRCQQYRFKPLSLQQIVENLRRILKSQEPVSIPESIVEETLFLIAKTSDGGMRDAQSLFDQVMSLADESLTLDEVELVLGGVRLDTLYELTSAVKERDAGRALRIVHACYNQGQDMALLVKDLLNHFRNLMVCRSAPEHAELLDLHPDQAKGIAEQSTTLSLEDLLQGTDILFEAERRLKLTSSPRAVCESAVIKLAKMPTTIEIEALLGRGDIPLRSPASGQVPSSDKSRESVANVPNGHPKGTGAVKSAAREKEPVAEKAEAITIQMDDSPDQEVIDTLIDRWQTICHRLLEVEVHFGGYLGDAIPRSYRKNRLELVIPEHLSLHYAQLNSPKAKEGLKAVLRETVGINPEIRVVTGTAEEVAQLRAPVLEHEVPPTKQVPTIEEVVQAEPVVGEILDLFDGSVIDIRDNPIG